MTEKRTLYLDPENPMDNLSEIYHALQDMGLDYLVFATTQSWDQQRQQYRQSIRLEAILTVDA